jgi:hypothetical protein
VPADLICKDEAVRYSNSILSLNKSSDNRYQGIHVWQRCLVVGILQLEGLRLLPVVYTVEEVRTTHVPSAV